MKVDTFRVQALVHLGNKSAPVSMPDLERIANEGVGLSDESRLAAIRDMQRHGWIKRTTDEYVIITMTGRIARNALKKAFGLE